jgi:hypothetical protein
MNDVPLPLLRESTTVIHTFVDGAVVQVATELAPKGEHPLHGRFVAETAVIERIRPTVTASARGTAHARSSAAAAKSACIRGWF